MVFLIVFRYLFHSCTQPTKHSKPLFFKWIQMILQFRKTWFLMISMIFSVTSFGIDFWWVLAPIVGPFWHPFWFKLGVFLIHFFGLYFGSEFCWVWIKVVPKDVPFVSPFWVLFCDLCPHTCTFYAGSARNIFFILLKTKRYASALVRFTLVRPTSVPWHLLPF